MSIFSSLMSWSKGKEQRQESGTELPRTRPKEAQPRSGTHVRPEPAADQSAPEAKSPTPRGTSQVPVWRPGDVILDLYEVEDVITTGGMGRIYVTRHRNWNVKIAIKSPTEALLADAEYAVRITREAEAWTELGLHPNIAYCYFVRHIEGVPHLFVEYVDGGSLTDWIIDQRCADLKTGLDLAIQFCHGMAHAHGKGMVHRDIKPDNVLLTQDGTLKVTDFGIARWGTEGESPVNRRLAPSEDTTKTLGFIGTEAYAAPEQWQDTHKVGPEADVFSFGLCLWEMFCGRRPYTMAVEKVAIPDPNALRPDLPESLADLLRQLVAFEVEARQQLGGFEALRERFKAIYEELFHEPSPHSELEQLDHEADGLNNRGVSLAELGHQQEALECFRQTLEKDPTHPQATYNKGLLDWRAGRITDDELVQRLEHCMNNPLVCSETASVLLARAHVERFSPRAAREVLKEFPGRFEALFGNQASPEVRCIAALKTHTKRVSSVCFSPDGRQALSGNSDKTLRLWDLKTHQCLATLKGHTSSVNSVRFSPDGRQALSGSDDRTLRFWDLETHQCLATLKGHTSSVKSVCISADGQHALSGGRDKTLRLWNLETRQCLATLEGHIWTVNSVCISADGHRALSGSGDDTLQLWDLQTHRCLLTLKGHADDVYSVDFSPDGRQALSGGEDETVRLWDLRTHQCLATLRGHTRAVTSVCFSHDARHALSAGLDETLRLWNLDTRQCLATLRGHANAIYSVCFSPDGLQALSGSSGGCDLRLWVAPDDGNIEEEMIRSFRMEFESNQKTCAVLIVRAKSDSAKWAICGFSDAGDFRTLMLDDPSNELSEELKKKPIDEHKIVELATSSLGRSGWEHTLRLWDMSAVVSGQRYSPAMELCQPRDYQALDAAKQELELSCQDIDAHILSKRHREALDRLLQEWRRRSFDTNPRLETRYQSLSAKGRPLGLVVVLASGEAHPGGSIESVDVSPDGRQALSGGRNGLIRLWDLETHQCLASLELDENPAIVHAVCFSPDGRQALSASEFKLFDVRDLPNLKLLRLWDLETHQYLATLPVPGRVNSVCFSPDGQHALSGGRDETLRLWNLETRQCLAKLKGHTSSVNSVRFSPDGRHALSGSGDNTLRLWDLETRQCLATLEGHAELVNSVAFSPDGRHALSGSGDNTLRLWDLETHQCLATLKGHTSSVKSVCFSPDGQHALSGGRDKTLRLWNLETRQCLAKLKGHTSSVNSVRFSPDGRQALSGSDDRTLRFWRLIWDLEFPQTADWDEGARPFLQTFLTLHCSVGEAGFSRQGVPTWTDKDFAQLYQELRRRGYGWLRREGVERELKGMASAWEKPPRNVRAVPDKGTSVIVINARLLGEIVAFEKTTAKVRVKGLFSDSELINTVATTNEIVFVFDNHFRVSAKSLIAEWNIPLAKISWIDRVRDPGTYENTARSVYKELQKRYAKIAHLHYIVPASSEPEVKALRDEVDVVEATGTGITVSTFDTALESNQIRNANVYLTEAVCITASAQLSGTKERRTFLNWLMSTLPHKEAFVEEIFAANDPCALLSGIFENSKIIVLDRDKDGADLSLPVAFSQADQNSVCLFAGLATVTCLLRSRIRLVEVDVISRTWSFRWDTVNGKPSSTRDYTDEITALLAARIAEEVMLGVEAVSTGGANFIQRSTEIASDIADRPESSSEPIKTTAKLRARIFDEQVRTIIESCYTKAQQLIAHHKADLLRVAEALRESPKLHGADIEKILFG